MQSLAWYARRLESMSLGEMLWRARNACRDSWDRLRLARGFRPSSTVPLSADAALLDLHACTLSPSRDAHRVFRERTSWAERLRSAADDIQDHRLSFFDLDRVHLGDPIDWHRDQSAQRAAPLVPSATIDYRDFAAIGDCKLIWEPNRHHQLVVLGRAYRATGDAAYARAVYEQLASWLDANPLGHGMNWRSPLELGIRLINWVWALELIKDAPEPNGKLRCRLVTSIYEHCWEIQRKYSKGSSANNHLIGEAAGVFVACSAFPSLPHATLWRHVAASILEDEIERQTYADGCTREHAFGYHLFVAQFFVVCKLVGERTGHQFSRSYAERLELMIEFAVSVMEAGRSMPKLGDCDDGYVVDFGDSVDDFDMWLAIGGLMFDRPEWLADVERPPESAYWLFGTESIRRIEAETDNVDAPAMPLRSKAFRESGYFLLQCGAARNADHISVLFDCAELGYGSIAAHGHADALSLTLRAYGHDVLVDTGTYDYFSHPTWREYFRGTAAHNTLRVDGRDQSVMLGPFLWGRRARSELLEWSGDGDRVFAKGRHDGYRSLESPVTHTRTILLDSAGRTVEIIDELEGRGEHDIDISFHVASACAVEPHGNAFVLSVGGRRILLEPDVRLSSAVHNADQTAYTGWISDGYHRKTPSATIVLRGRAASPSTFRTVIRVP